MVETEAFDGTLSEVNNDGFNVRDVYLKRLLEVAFRRARKRGSKRDTPSAILSRHAEFSKDLQKRLGLIRQRYDVIEVDGTKSAWHVARDVRMALMPDHYEVIPTELGVRQKP